MRRLLILTVVVVMAVCVACGRNDEQGGASATLLPATTTIPATTTPAVAVPVVARDIVITTLELGGGFYSGHFGSIAIGADGFPLLSYLYEGEGVTQEDSTFSIVLAKCSDPTCSAEPTTTSIDIVQWGQPPSLAFGPDGLATMVFTDWPEEGSTTPGEPTDVRLKVASCLDAACSDLTIVDVGSGQSGSLVVPPDGLPLIVFNELEDIETVALKCGDPTCSSGNTTTTLEGARYAFNTPVVVGPDELPIVSYTRNNPEDPGSGANVAVVLCDDPSCSDGGTTVQVADAPVNADLTQLAISAEGHPVVLFGDGRQMWLTRCVDPKCSVNSEPMQVGRRGPINGAALAVAPDGLPVIAYTQEQPENEGGRDLLLVAKCTDPECSEGTLATIADPGDTWGVTMAFDPEGMPVIAYWSPRSDFNIAFCGDPACEAGASDMGAWDQTEIVEPEPEAVGVVMAGWRALSDEESALTEQGWINSVVSGGPGLVAVGSTCELVEGNSDCAPAAWSSADGLVWTMADPGAFGQGEIWDLASHDGVVVAVGGSCGMEDFGDDCAPAVWTSSDGLTWDRVPHDEEVFTSCLSVEDEWCRMSMDTVAAARPGFVASGWTPNGIAIWTSTDGMAWTRTAFDAPPDLGGDAEADWWIEGMSASGSGIVGVGTMCVPTAYAYLGVSGEQTDSGDGVVINVEEASAAEDAGLESGDVLLAVDGELVVYGGLRSLVTANDPGDAVILTVQRSGEELSIEATLGEYEDWPCTGLLWTSTDGTHWELSPELDLGADGDTHIWPITSWEHGLATVAETCDLSYNCTNVVLTSPDGIAWQQHDPGELFAGVQIFRVFPFDSGLLALGGRFDEFEGTEESVWFTSDDAIIWTPFAVDPELFEGEGGFFNDLASIDSRVVGVGVGIWVWEPPE